MSPSSLTRATLRGTLALCLGLGSAMVGGFTTAPAPVSSASPAASTSPQLRADSSAHTGTDTGGAELATGGSSSAAQATTTAASTRTFVVNVGSGAPLTPAAQAAAATAVRAARGTVVQSWPRIGVLVVRSASADFAKRLRPSPASGITSVGPTRTVPDRAPLRTRSGAKAIDGLDDTSGPTAPTDPREREQWGLKTVGAPASARVGAGVTVAVVDSGVQPNHPDLRGRIDTARSVDCTDGGRPDATGTRWRNTTSGHGTHVAGIIAAARNGVGVTGVAPGARVASVKVVDDDGFIYPEYAICGILRTADSGLRIANHSYYVDPWRFWCANQPSQAPAREAVRRAFAYAQQRGVLSVAAAGNDSTDLAHKTSDTMSPNDGRPVTRKLDRSCLDLPAELPGVVTVSAADPNGSMAAYSNYGRGVIDVMAPGTEILSTYPDSQWAPLSGTSMASPHVAGVAAILLGKQPKARPEALLAMLRTQARDVPCPRGARTCTGSRSDNAFAGQGMVDARRAGKR